MGSVLLFAGRSVMSSWRQRSGPRPLGSADFLQVMEYEQKAKTAVSGRFNPCSSARLLALADINLLLSESPPQRRYRRLGCLGRKKDVKRHIDPIDFSSHAAQTSFNATKDLLSPAAGRRVNAPLKTPPPPPLLRSRHHV